MLKLKVNFCGIHRECEIIHTRSRSTIKAIIIFTFVKINAKAQIQSFEKIFTDLHAAAYRPKLSQTIIG